MGTFGDQLKALLRKRQFTVRSFAEAAHTSRSCVSRITLGSGAVPLARLPAWCDILGLRGQERQTFLDLGALTHLPEPERTRFLHLYEDLHDLKKENAELHQLVRRAADS